jgi:hypothetical protein
MPLRRFSPERGYYEAVTWRQIAIGGFVVLVLGAVTAIVLSIRAAQLTPQQEAILAHVNCLRAQAGQSSLDPDPGLMRQAQELAESFAANEWQAMQKIQAQGGGVARVAPEQTPPEDPCYRRWFTILDPQQPALPLITSPDLLGVGFGYVLRPAAANGIAEEIVVYLVR